jgi:hypothetical protein
VIVETAPSDGEQVVAFGSDPTNVEITMELDSTWLNQTRTNHYSYSAKCVVSENGCYISGNFAKNAEVEHWLVGSNMTERVTVTDSMHLRRAEDWVYEKILRKNSRSKVIGSSYPRAGDTFTTVRPAPMGRPTLAGPACVVWLAFCSGDYLKQPHRKIPVPGPRTGVFGFSDETTPFKDAVGLPKTMRVFTEDGTTTFEYKVLRETNYLAWTFPLEFRFTQYEHRVDETTPRFARHELHGKVTSIGQGDFPQFSDEVRESPNR